MQRHGAVPDAISCSALISACEKDMHAAQVGPEGLSGNVQQGVVPNVFAYRALIGACEKGKQQARALEVF